MAEQQSSASKKLPIPPLASTAYTAKITNKKGKQEERKAKRKELNRARDKSRVNIGVDIQRWRKIRDLEELKTDAEMATFLLDGYEKNPSIFKLLKRRWKRPPPQHVSTIVSESLNNSYERMKASNASKDPVCSTPANTVTANPPSSVSPGESNRDHLHLAEEPRLLEGKNLEERDHNTTNEEEVSDAAFNNKVHSSTEHLHLKDVISVVVKSEDEENPVTLLTEMKVKEEPDQGVEVHPHCSSSGNTECLCIKDIISVVVKSEDEEEKPVALLTEVKVKEEPKTCSSADVIKGQ